MVDGWAANDVVRDWSRRDAGNDVIRPCTTF